MFDEIFLWSYIVVVTISFWFLMGATQWVIRSHDIPDEAERSNHCAWQATLYTLGLFGGSLLIRGIAYAAGFS